MDSQEIEPFASELPHRSIDERIKQSTDPLLRRVRQSCALLGSQTELKPTERSEASGSRRDNVSCSPSRLWHDNLFNFSKIQMKVKLFCSNDLMSDDNYNC